jgi:hypothetical protein
VDGHVVSHLLYLIFGLLERHLPTFLHGWKVQKRCVAVQSINEISKASQGDAVILTV